MRIETKIKLLNKIKNSLSFEKFNNQLAIIILNLIIHGISLVIRFIFIFVLPKNSSIVIFGLYSIAVAIESVTIYISGFEVHTFIARRYALRPNISRLRVLMANHKKILLISSIVAGIVTFLLAQFLNFSESIFDVLLLVSIVISGSYIQEIGRYLILTKKTITATFMHFLRTSAWQPLILVFSLTKSEDITLRSILFRINFWGMEAWV